MMKHIAQALPALMAHSSGPPGSHIPLAQALPAPLVRAVPVGPYTPLHTTQKQSQGHHPRKVALAHGVYPSRLSHRDLLHFPCGPYPPH